MKKAIPILLALLVGVSLGFVLTKRDSIESSEPADAHDGHDHAPGEGHEHDVAGAALDWCLEHRVPESACTKCNPTLIAEFKDHNDWCVEHGLPESHCRLCNPKLEFPIEAAMRANEPQPELGLSVFYPANQPLCATNEALIQLASSETFSRAGLSLEPVREAPTPGAIEAPAEVVFDEETAAMMTLPVRASIVRWLVQPGETVREGQMLALCESQDVARLKGEYLEACADAERHEKDQVRQEELFNRKLIDAATYETAKAETHTASAKRHGAESELAAIGLNNADLEEIRIGGKLSARFALRSPQAGVLVERVAQIGDAVEEGTHLATVTDPSALWIEARVRDTDLSRIKTGQSAVFTTDGDHLERAEGRVIWISQYLEPATRTGIVRVRPNGGDLILRANQFGNLHFAESGVEMSVLIPKDAVQWEGCCHVVFVRESENRFRPRKVTLAKGDTDHYRVLAGLHQDEWIVVRGSFLLKTELKKSSIGAGCCGLDAKS